MVEYDKVGRENLPAKKESLKNEINNYLIPSIVEGMLDSIRNGGVEVSMVMCNTVDIIDGKVDKIKRSMEVDEIDTSLGWGVYGKEVGDMYSVGIPGQPGYIIYTDRIIFHTHPDGQPPSPADVSTFCMNHGSSLIGSIIEDDLVLQLLEPSDKLNSMEMPKRAEFSQKARDEVYELQYRDGISTQEFLDKYGLGQYQSWKAIEGMPMGKKDRSESMEEYIERLRSEYRNG